MAENEESKIGVENERVMWEMLLTLVIKIQATWQQNPSWDFLVGKYIIHTNFRLWSKKSDIHVEIFMGHLKYSFNK